MKIFERMSVTRQFLVPLTSIVYIYFPTMEVNGTRNCLVTDILLNILFSVQQKKFIQFWKNRRVSILWQNIHF